jgi:hypothetical protein
VEKKKREPFKFIEVAGKNYRIGKFDALTGSYYIFRITNGGMAKSKAEFFEMQKDLLRFCSEVKPAQGESPEMFVPIITQDGRIVDEALSADTDALLEITMTALEFNTEGFFDVGA